MNGYELSRAWFDWCFDNPDKYNSNHTAMFLWICDKWNRLGQKEKFGLPSIETMEILRIKSKNTYYSVFNDLVNFGFIIIVTKSINQNTSMVVSLNQKIIRQTHGKRTALDLANVQQTNGTVPIIEPETINHKPIKKEYTSLVKMHEVEFEKLVYTYGEEKTRWMITALDNYKGSSGKKYKDDYRAILTWVVAKAEKEYKGKQIAKPISINPNGYPNAQVYYSTCWENKATPVRFENGEFLSESEIEEQHKLHKVGKYQYA